MPPSFEQFPPSAPAPEEEEGEDYKPLTEAEKERRKELRKKVEQAISGVLKPEGFKKDGSNWRRELEDLVQVFYLQRSQFSHSYMFEAGIFLKELAGDLDEKRKKKPRIEDCHVRGRIGDFTPKEQWKEFKDLRLEGEEGDLDDEESAERIEKVRAALEAHVLPALEKMTTYEGIKELAEEKHQEGRWFSTHGAARRLLGIDYKKGQGQ
jgi:hypothetical protein